MVRVEFHDADNMPTLRIEGRFAAKFGRRGSPLAKQFQSVLPVPQSVGRGISSAGGRGRKARASSAFALNSLPTAV